MVREQVLALTVRTERLGLWFLLGLALIGGLYAVAAARPARPVSRRPERMQHRLGAWVCVRDSGTTTIVAGGLWGTSVVVDRERAVAPAGSTVRGPRPGRRRPPPVPACAGSGRLRPSDAQLTAEQRAARIDRHPSDGRPAHRRLNRRDPSRSCAHR